MPKLAMTRLAGHYASKPLGGLTTSTIRRFVARYGVDMAEAAEPDIAAYATFNDFFTRALKPGARPIADAPLVCPVDGTISQVGRIEGDQVFQAKGRKFSTTALVGGDAALAASSTRATTNSRASRATSARRSSTRWAPRRWARRATRWPSSTRGCACTGSRDCALPTPA